MNDALNIAIAVEERSDEDIAEISIGCLGPPPQDMSRDDERRAAATIVGYLCRLESRASWVASAVDYDCVVELQCDPIDPDSLADCYLWISVPKRMAPAWASHITAWLASILDQ